VTKEAKQIKPSVKREVLMEAGYKCANPNCRVMLTIEIHHMWRVADGGTNTLDNLIALCPNCHTAHHHGIIPEEAIRVYKSVLVALTGAYDLPTIDDLLFLEKTERPLNYSADGVLHFRRLIASGLAKTKLSVGEASGGWEVTSHRIDLTERGKNILNAWRQGENDALEKALAGEGK